MGLVWSLISFAIGFVFLGIIYPIVMGSSATKVVKADKNPGTIWLILGIIFQLLGFVLLLLAMRKKAPAGVAAQIQAPRAQPGILPQQAGNIAQQAALMQAQRAQPGMMPQRMAPMGLGGI